MMLMMGFGGYPPFAKNLFATSPRTGRTFSERFQGHTVLLCGTWRGWKRMREFSGGRGPDELVTIIVRCLIYLHDF